ncbi:MAG: DNA polymerase III subunit chi [Rhodobacteraceae bacterium]|nr:DNA polymerase III subunit chi [Paracoccaceae bacterium]
MGAVWFYHLTQSPPDRVLALLLPRALEAGWRVAVRSPDAARLDWLDEQLWLGAEEAFLPHGRAGGPHDADQPVLLTTAADCPNGASCVIALDGAPVSAAEAAALARACILFDGHDPAALEAARAQWRALTGAGLAAEYWAEDGGRWQRKATRPPA